MHEAVLRREEKRPVNYSCFLIITISSMTLRTKQDTLSAMTMASRPALPILQQGRYIKTRGRKYGGYDFERFDNLSSSHASIGHRSFDKVNVNCRFLFKKSKWGVLGECKNPAGIVYLDLTFDQPKDAQRTYPISFQSIIAELKGYLQCDMYSPMLSRKLTDL